MLFTFSRVINVLFPSTLINIKCNDIFVEKYQTVVVIINIGLVVTDFVLLTTVATTRYVLTVVVKYGVVLTVNNTAEVVV